MLTRRDFLKLIPGAAGVAAGVGVVKNATDDRWGVAAGPDLGNPEAPAVVFDGDGWRVTDTWLADAGDWSRPDWIDVTHRGDAERQRIRAFPL